MENTNYVSPYAALPPPPPPFQFDTPDHQFRIEPSPDSTIEVLQPPEPNLPEPAPSEPVEPAVARKKRGRPLKQGTQVESVAGGGEGECSLGASTEPVVGTLNQVYTVTATVKDSSGGENKRSASSLPPDTPPPKKKRAYKKRTPKVKFSPTAAILNNNKNTAEVAILKKELQTANQTIQEVREENQQIKDQLGLSTESADLESQLQELQEYKDKVHDMSMDRRPLALYLMGPLTEEVLKDIIAYKAMQHFPNPILLDELKAAEAECKIRGPIKEEKSLRTRLWVNDAPSDVSMEDDVAGDDLFEFGDVTEDEEVFGEEFDVNDGDAGLESASRDDSASDFEGPSSARPGRQPRSRPGSVRKSASGAKKPLKRTSSGRARTAGCVEVGILKNHPHNVVTAGIDSRGRLNWRVLRVNRQQEVVGCPNGPGTRKDLVDLHPTLVNLDDDMFRQEIRRRQAQANQLHVNLSMANASGNNS